jgi:hypothetical protein
VAGIELPEFPVADLRETIRAAADGLRGDKRVLSFGCSGSSTVAALRKAGESVVDVKCMGQIPPSFLDFILSRDLANAVLLTGCSDGRCRYRFGTHWKKRLLLPEIPRSSASQRSGACC